MAEATVGALSVCGLLFDPRVCAGVMVAGAGHVTHLRRGRVGCWDLLGLYGHRRIFVQLHRDDGAQVALRLRGVLVSGPAMRLTASTA